MNNNNNNKKILHTEITKIKPINGRGPSFPVKVYASRPK